MAYWLNNVFASGLSVHGDQLLLSQGGWGVQLMDVGDPLNPVYSGHLYRPYETGWTYRANLIGDLVYLGDIAKVYKTETETPRLLYHNMGEKALSLGISFTSGLSLETALPTITRSGS